VKEINYFSVLGPGGRTIANFETEREACQFRDRVVKVRLNQLERIKDVLTDGEYHGEHNFRTFSITVSPQAVTILSSLESNQMTDDMLVDGSFLVPG